MRRAPHRVPERPVVWIVGASRGIGQAIATEFASAGCTVCLSGRDRRALASVAESIANTGGRASLHPLDLMKEASVARAARSILRRYGRVDVLINNGGITVFKSFASTSMAEFNRIIDTNLRGPIACTKAVLPGMLKRRRGLIINILSTAAVKTFTGSSAYTATKSAMLGLSNVLREELRASHVKVVNVLPGATETAMWSLASRKRHGRNMMTARSVAECVLALFQLPEDVVAEELLLRPLAGDVG
jgi:short-subunit dehydrogenase